LHFKADNIVIFPFDFVILEARLMNFMQKTQSWTRRLRMQLMKIQVFLLMKKGISFKFWLLEIIFNK